MVDSLSWLNLFLIAVAAVAGGAVNALAGGGTHQHHGIVGKVGQAHVLFRRSCERFLTGVNHSTYIGARSRERKQSRMCAMIEKLRPKKKGTHPAEAK